MLTAPVSCSALKMYRGSDEEEYDLSGDEGELGLCEAASGRSYIMYHGTTRQNAYSIQATGFRQSPGGMLGRGVYLSRDLEKARCYPINHPDWDKVVIKVRVNVGKVIAINRQRHALQKTWHDHGYDSAWVPPNCGMVKSGREEDCVWNPKRIKILKIIKPGPKDQQPEQTHSEFHIPSPFVVVFAVVILACFTLLLIH